MHNVRELQATIDKLRSGRLGPDKIRQYLSHASPLVRANAIEASALLANQDIALINDLRIAACSDANGISLMGNVTLKHIAIGCLLRIGSIEAKEAVECAIRSLSVAERENLLIYLESENIPL
jgi:hypothetical protein